MNATKSKEFAKKVFYISLLILVGGNVFVWYSVIFAGEIKNLELGFLDVGQGDSQLINFDGVQILIDGGKGPKVLSELPKLMALGDRYIDLVIATHPDLDHFGGLIDVIKTYEVGAVITNGRKGTASAYADFEKVIKDRHVSEVVLREGDRGLYEDLLLSVLSPDIQQAAHKKVNESGLVFLLEKDGLRALYTADIGFETEQKLIKEYDLAAHILKVPHHGSKFSSGSLFLKEVNPSIAVVEVGKNTYGHPTGAVLGRLADNGSRIFRP